MNSRIKLTLLAAAIAAGTALGGQAALAQQGPLIDANTLDPRLKDIGNAIGAIRSNIVFGQVNALGYDGTGTYMGQEATIRLDNAFFEQAFRWDIQPASGDRTIEVVNDDRAWNEGPEPGLNPMELAAEDAEWRQALLWLDPHGFIRAVTHATLGQCPDGSDCPGTTTAISEEGGNIVIDLSLRGVNYRGTIGADMRPAQIEAQIQGKAVVATFEGWRNGAGIGDALDKNHAGAYFPQTFAFTVDGEPLLEMNMTAGWSNRYMVFPTPDVLAASDGAWPGPWPE